MRKHTFEVPIEARYLSEIDRFELPNGILDKGITNCGATTVAIEDCHKTIICSPRNNLIINKHEQHKGTMLVIGAGGEGRVMEYLSSAETPKILTSFDSFAKVARCIADKSDWRVVVDECQYLIIDSSFKSETEMGFLKILEEFPYVTYLSATPLLDKYIGQMEHFKDKDYYELHWQNVEKIGVVREKAKKPVDSALEIVRNYKKGIFPSISIGGETAYSKECVIYLNSVTNISDIIKQAGLSPDEVNIIVGNSSENDKLIAKIGDGFSRGRIPMKGEPHKMFTFCTSTAFAGCDFYSTCASTFVISDCHRRNTTIDIATDLVQIAGRQRLEENPFRKMLHFIYNASYYDFDDEEFESELARKMRLTLADVDNYNSITDSELREHKIKEVYKMQKMLDYSEVFTMYDKHTDRFVFNDMAYLSCRYAYDVQRFNYQNGISLRCELENNNFEMLGNQYYAEYAEQLTEMTRREPFTERMKRYCGLKESRKNFNLALMMLDEKYPELKMFYEELGADKIKALSYKESALKNEVATRQKNGVIRNELCRALEVGKSYPSTDIKEIMNGIYAKLGVKKKGKVEDLRTLYGFDVKLVKETTADGSRKNRYRILGRI